MPNNGPESQTILVGGGIAGITAAVEVAKDADADVIATPCPLCQQNVEMDQGAVNKKYGTDYNTPVVFYSQLMAVAFGMDANKDACLDRNTIRSDKLEKPAKKG